MIVENSTIKKNLWNFNKYKKKTQKSNNKKSFICKKKWKNLLYA